MRLSSAAVIAVIAATLGLCPVDISGQGKPSYTPPRTPWGDPDLQGTFSNKYEQSTPLERPDQFAGRRVEDVAGAELADVLAKRNKQVIERAAGVGPLQFRDPLEVTRGSRAWLIVDPPDGKIPPMTPPLESGSGRRIRSRTPASRASSTREFERRAASTPILPSGASTISICGSDALPVVCLAR